MLNPEPMINATEIAERIDTMASEIAAKMQDDMVVVGLLKGCFVFVADLVRALNRHGASVAVDFMHLSSYGNATESSGSVMMVSDVTMDLVGRRVLIVDDILDSGRTLLFARDRIVAHNPQQVMTAVLLDKPSRREVALPADFVGFAIEDVFVAGYGIDYAEKYRDLPHIFRAD